MFTVKKLAQAVRGVEADPRTYASGEHRLLVAITHRLRSRTIEVTLNLGDAMDIVDPSRIHAEDGDIMMPLDALLDVIGGQHARVAETDDAGRLQAGSATVSLGRMPAPSTARSRRDQGDEAPDAVSPASGRASDQPVHEPGEPGLRDPGRRPGLASSAAHLVAQRWIDDAVEQLGQHDVHLQPSSIVTTLTRILRMRLALLWSQPAASTVSI